MICALDAIVMEVQVRVMNGTDFYQVSLLGLFLAGHESDRPLFQARI